MILGKFIVLNTLIYSKFNPSYIARHINYTNKLSSMDYFNRKVSQSNELVNAGGIILYRMNNGNPEFILLKSSNDPFHYTPPKGRLEDGETFGSAAKRETLEESGISPDMYEIDQDFAKSLKYKANTKDKECVYFLAKVHDPNTKIILSDEHTSYEWADLENVKKLCSHQMIIDAITDAYSHINRKN